MKNNPTKKPPTKEEKKFDINKFINKFVTIMFGLIFLGCIYEVALGDEENILLSPQLEELYATQVKATHQTRCALINAKIDEREDRGYSNEEVQRLVGLLDSECSGK